MSFMHRKGALVVRVKTGGVLLAWVRLTSFMPSVLSTGGFDRNLAYLTWALKAPSCLLSLFWVPTKTNGLNPRRLTCNISVPVRVAVGLGLMSASGLASYVAVVKSRFTLAINNLFKDSSDRCWATP